MEQKQKEQLKKALVFGGLGLLFTLSIYFIFAPSEKDRSAAGQGLNDSIPQATTEQLTENKLKAYELGSRAVEEEQARAEMGRLSDYFDQTDKVSEGSASEATATDKIENSVQRYEANNRLLADFYTDDPYEEEREAMRQEIEELRQQLYEQSFREEDEEERQLALMEKSYQMAAKYLPGVSGQSYPPNEMATAQEAPQMGEKRNKGDAPAMEVLAEHKQIVSSLDQPMSDEEFVEEYGTKERHLGFHSLSHEAIATFPNTLRVVVDRTTTLKEGEYVQLRLLEPAKVHSLTIPRQSLLTAQAKIEGNRMHLYIRSIEVDGRIMPVRLSAYDTDGQEGIYVPGSEEVSALREMGANIGGSMGTSFTFSSSAKDQIISETARGVVQGANQLLQKKLRTVKVTLKGGYRLFLVQTK